MLEIEPPMAEEASKQIVHIGVLEVDLSSGELHKHGLRVRLPGQPFKILAMLLERPGKVVTRKELKDRLWPSDTFVDFEHGLNTAIQKLRDALGDSADRPLYIETLPRLGYRFIAPVREQEDFARKAVAGAGRDPGAGVEQARLTSAAVAPDRAAGLLSAARRKESRKWMAASALAAALLGAAGFWLFETRSRAPLGAADSVLVADFVNTTGDPVFDDALKQAESVQLLQSPFLNILSDAKVNSTLRLMTKPPGTRLTQDLVRDVCLRAGGKAYIAGSIKSLGSEYLLDLVAVNCQTGDAIAREEATANRKEQVLNALGDATTRLRKKLGESLMTLQKFDTPIEEATTPSLEALQALSRGIKRQQVEGNAAAIPFIERAIELDPNFAAAYALLGTSYSNLREPELASENLSKAYGLRNKVSERERFRISAYYFHLVTGELEKANEIYETWAQVFPRDNVPRSNLGVTYGYLGQYDKAVAEIQEALRLFPDSAAGYTNLVSHYTALNRLSDAKAIWAQAQSRKIDNPFLHLNRYGVAFLEGDSAEMQRQVAWAMGKPQAENLLLSAQSDTEASAGQLERAREFSRRASDSARRYDQNETAAEWEMNAALRESEFGNFALARKQARTELAQFRNREIEILAALTLARSGEARQAREIADKLEKDFPLDTANNHYWLPSVRAAIELHAGNPAKAIEVLQTAAAYELGNPLPQTETGACLYPAYLRGQAYLAIHQGREAAAEFQKLIDHRGISVNCPLGSLAHLGLARAFVLQSDPAKARAAYQEFLALWKNADPGLRILQQAKAEYAKLE